MPVIIASSGPLTKTKLHVEDSGGPGRPVVSHAERFNSALIAFLEA